MESTAYKVKTSVFEGPLDLLLSLIEKRKLFVNEISLTQVTDDYIAYVNTLPKVNFSEMANFIVVAATLILIKSKSLLPNMQLTEEEEGSIEELEARLQMYRVIKEIGVEIKSMFGKNIIFEKPYTVEEVAVFAPSKGITAQNMLSFIQDVIEHVPKTEKFPEVTVRKVINIEEMIEKLTDRIQSSLKLSFEEFSDTGAHKDSKEKRMYVIVGFLAMLELVRQGLINVIQEEHFDDIDIHVSNSHELENSAVSSFDK